VFAVERQHGRARLADGAHDRPAGTDQRLLVGERDPSSRLQGRMGWPHPGGAGNRRNDDVAVAERGFDDRLRTGASLDLRSGERFLQICVSVRVCDSDESRMERFRHGGEPCRVPAPCQRRDPVSLRMPRENLRGRTANRAGGPEDDDGAGCVVGCSDLTIVFWLAHGDSFPVRCAIGQPAQGGLNRPYLKARTAREQVFSPSSTYNALLASMRAFSTERGPPCASGVDYARLSPAPVTAPHDVAIANAESSCNRSWPSRRHGFRPKRRSATRPEAGMRAVPHFRLQAWTVNKRPPSCKQHRTVLSQ